MSRYILTSVPLSSIECNGYGIPIEDAYAYSPGSLIVSHFRQAFFLVSTQVIPKLDTFPDFEFRNALGTSI